MPRRFLFPSSLHQWLTLLTGIVLGCVFTSTIMFHMWWCSEKVALSDLSLDRQMVSIIKVNEHIRAHAGGMGGVDDTWQRDALSLEKDSSNCVCGEELRKLKSAQRQFPTMRTPSNNGDPQSALDATYKASSFVTKPSVPTFSVDWKSFNNTSSNFSLFVHPPEHMEDYLSEEFPLRRSVIVAVNVGDNGLQWASQIYDTWGQDVPKILFFISETCNVSEPEAVGLPLVKLTGLDGTFNDAVKRSFSILSYLHSHYSTAYHWFVLADHQTFIHVHRMEQVLARFDSSSKVYLGWAAKGRADDQKHLQLLPNEYYCLGSSGVVLSNAALGSLAPELEFCQGAVETHNSETPGVNHWRNWDVELGRCMSRRVGIQCSLSTEAKAYFYQDFSPKTSLSSKALNFPPFTHLLTYNPLPQPSSHLYLHLHYKKAEFQESLEATRYIQEQIKYLCEYTVEDDKCTVYICACEESATSTMCSSKCPTADTVNSLSKSYTPVSKFDIPTWEYFDSLAIYNDETTIPGYWLSVCKDRKNELQAVLNQVLLEARAQTGRRMLKFRKIVNGYVRHNPSRGMEYIVDGEFTEGRAIIKTRVSIVRPLAKNYITLGDNNDKKTQINFIVPISNVSERFRGFMSMYEGCCLKQDSSLHLLLVVYGEKDVKFVQETIKPYLKKYKKALITVIKGTGVFSRGRALHLGMSNLEPEELAFHCDVDMTIQTPFMQRCRKNTIQGARIYYPEFFKLYNLDYVYPNTQRPKKISLKRQHGHWASYSFGMLCIYKSDYDTVGGMDTSIIGWGEEDVKFFEHVLKTRSLEVFRVPDTGLIHRWHEKHCPDSLSEEQKDHCHSSRAENLADRIQLADYIYSHDYQIKYPASTQDSTSQHSSR